MTMRSTSRFGRISDNLFKRHTNQKKRDNHDFFVLYTTNDFFQLIYSPAFRGIQHLIRGPRIHLVSFRQKSQVFLEVKNMKNQNFRLTLAPHGPKRRYWRVAPSKKSVQREIAQLRAMISNRQQHIPI